MSKILNFNVTPPYCNRISDAVKRNPFRKVNCWGEGYVLTRFNLIQDSVLRTNRRLGYEGTLTSYSRELRIG